MEPDDIGARVGQPKRIRERSRSRPGRQRLVGEAKCLSASPVVCDDITANVRESETVGNAPPVAV